MGRQRQIVNIQVGSTYAHTASGKKVTVTSISARILKTVVGLHIIARDENDKEYHFGEDAIRHGFYTPFADWLEEQI